VRGFSFITTLFVVATCLSASADDSVVLYSEQSYLQREAIVTSDLRVRYESPLNSWARPYLQAGTEYFQAASESSLFDEAGFAYLQPGLRLLEPGPFAIFVGPRLRAAYAGASVPLIDARAMLVFGKYFERPIDSAWKFFGEIYSESIYTSADEHNFLQTAFVRAGIRHQWKSGLFLDGFLEPYAAFSMRNRPNQERSDARGTIRFGGFVDRVQLSLSLSYLATAQWPWAVDSRLPASGVRGLFVMGGEW